VRVRGPVVDAGSVRTVDTQYGQTDLLEVQIRPDRGASPPARVTLWGKWTETADHLEKGMELLVTDVEAEEYRGETGYATTGDSFVVVEPDFLVDVTAVRSWVQCPRMYYLNKLSGVPLAYPVVKGTIVHEVFGDLLRGRDLEAAVTDNVAEAGMELGLLGRDRESVEDEVRRNAAAIDGWLRQGVLTGEDEWRSERTLLSETFGIKGRADAVRRGVPVELKTGKNTRAEPRFQDKVQAACYALVLGEHDGDGDGEGDGGFEHPDTGTLIYTKNAALDRAEEDGDLSPAKDFGIGHGFLAYVLRQRNAIAATEFEGRVPTGYEADARCEYCFEQDTCMVVSGRLDQESKAGRIGSPVPEVERTYFDRFYRAIEAERRVVHREYRKLWEQSAEERADDDRALVGLEPDGQQQLESGRWELTARKDPGTVSKIRDGDFVLASEGHPTRTRAELGRVRELGERVVVETDEPLSLRRVDVYPSELGVDRSLTALHDTVLKGDADRKAVLFGDREPTFGEIEGTYVDNNDAQDRAVRRALAADAFALVHGPPGTGKTYTLATLVCELVARGERVLVSAFTNRAVDNAVEAVLEQGFEDVVRVGNESGVREDMQGLLLETRGDPAGRAARLEDAPVVAATTASCGSRTLREAEFDVAVVDEAGQLTEPGTLLATNLADRFVLVGDHQQLPPVVQSTDERAEPLRTSLFERLIDDHPEAGVLLDRQYRMAQRVQWFPSEEFYDGQLRPADPSVAGRSLADLDVDVDALPPDLRDQVVHRDPGGERVGNTNPVEAEAVADLVREYLTAGVDPDDVGVIAPFRAQVAEISRRLPEVAVDTVDRFQGSAKEVVVVSVTATGSVEGPIFEDHRRMNVALTRAKRALAVVGDESALRSEPFYERMLAWAGSGTRP
jgi:DNA replication ATP-dependent helicase Dna2